MKDKGVSQQIIKVDEFTEGVKDLISTYEEKPESEHNQQVLKKLKELEIVAVAAFEEKEPEQKLEYTIKKHDLLNQVMRCMLEAH